MKIYTALTIISVFFILASMPFVFLGAEEETEVKVVPCYDSYRHEIKGLICEEEAISNLTLLGFALLGTGIFNSIVMMLMSIGEGINDW